MLNFIFKWLVHKTFKIKMILFYAVNKYRMLLLICENFRKNYTQ